MPRLPDKSALGGLPSLSTGRQYASAGEAKADVSGSEAMSTALAKGFQGLAGTVERIAENELQQQDALDLIRANASHAEKLRDTQNAFDTDPDFRTYRPRFAEAATQATADVAAGIANPKLRQRWVEQANERNSSYMDRVLDRGTRLAREDKELEVTKALDRYRDLYLQAPDDPSRQRILDDIDVTVTAGQRTGLLDRSRGELLRGKALSDVLRDDAERRLMAGETTSVMRDLGALPDPNRKPAVLFRPEVQSAADTAADEVGVPRSIMNTFIRIESDGNPLNTTGSYKGLLQLSEEEFRKYGGRGSIYDPKENARVGAIKLKAEMDAFEGKFGRPPTAAELYMIHQQGEGGAEAHWRNPDQPAWKSMAGTAEGRQKGERWAKQAIWGNVPDDVKARYGSVDNITSGDFTKLWEDKVSRMGGDDGVSGRYARMPFQQRHALITRARIAMSAETQQDLRDAYQEILDTGTASKDKDGLSAFDRARLFLQPNQVKRAEMQLQEAQSMHEAISPLRGMTEQQAIDHLNKLRDPLATGERAATARKVVAAAEKAWDEISTERSTDPVEAVDPFRNVRTQRAGRTRRADDVSGAYDLVKRRFPDVQVRETAAGAYEIMDPENPTPEALAQVHRARRAVIDARMEAQAKLGVPAHQQQPISKREADRILDLPDTVNTMTTAEYRMRLQNAADRAEALYGKELGPVVLESALSMRKAGDAEHKQEADRLMRRLARGEKVAASDVRRLNDLRSLSSRQVFDHPRMDQMTVPPPAPMPTPAAAPQPPPVSPAGRPTELPAMRSGGGRALPAPTAPAPANGTTLPSKGGAEPSQTRKTQSGYYRRQQAPVNPYDDLDGNP